MTDVVDLSQTSVVSVVSPLPIVSVNSYADAAQTLPFAAVTVYILDQSKNIVGSAIADFNGLAQIPVAAGTYYVHSIWTEMVGGIFIEDDGWTTVTVGTTNVSVKVTVWGKGHAALNGTVTTSKASPFNVGDTITVSIPIWNVGVAAMCYAQVIDQTNGQTYTATRVNVQSGGTATFQVLVQATVPTGNHTWVIQGGHVE